jgi:outer membrane protein insertion porin family
MNRACVVAIVLTPAIVHAEPEPAPRPPTGRFILGAGFTADEGFIAHAVVAQDDLFGTGQRLSLGPDVSALGHELRVAHEVPDLLGAGLALRSELFDRRRTYGDVVREGTGGAVTLGHQLDRATRIYARYQLEQVAGTGRLGALGAGIVYDTLDTPSLPTRGNRLELFAERFDPALGSDHRLMKAAARLDHASPLGPFTVRLSGRGAYVRSLEAGGVPLSERLPHDGHSELAGYPLGWFGSADLEATGRVELELPLVRRIGLSVAGFAEGGVRYNADPAWGATGATFARTVGASIIWRSPIGALRFDWAVPLDRGAREPIFLFGLR